MSSVNACFVKAGQSSDIQPPDWCAIRIVEVQIMYEASKKNDVSLLPYLHDNKGFALKLDLADRQVQDIDSGFSPFITVSERDPLTRLVKAEIVTHPGAAVQELFLLLSKDGYVFSDIDPKLVSNRLIDTIWQQSLVFFKSLSLPDQPVWLHSAADSSQVLPRFRPLFFCMKQGKYFHPPCPVCGRQLELAEDDQLLEQYGLSPYTSTIHRYLYCRYCAQEGRGAFFTIGKKAGATRNASVRQMDELVLSWTGLVEKVALASCLPCVDCADRSACFSQDGAVLGNIRAFAFYPFYMFMFKAPEMPANSFIELVSGRKDAESDFGDGASFFFKQGDPRFFMEVLFLKLSFLCQVFRDVFLKPGRRPVRMSLLMDKLWVRLPMLPGLLPRLWAFNPVFIGLSDDIREMVMPRPFASHILLDFAILWFHVLCTSRFNDRLIVNKAVEELISMAEQGEMSSWAQADSMVKDILSPESLFWDAPKGGTSQEFVQVWEQVMSFGTELIKTATQSLTDQDIEQLVQSAEGLAASVRQAMLQGAVHPVAIKAFADDSDREIVAIIDGLLNKWRKEAVVAVEAPSSMPSPEKIHGGSPVTIGHQYDMSHKDVSEEETLPLGMGGDDSLPETVIISSGHNMPDADIKVSGEKPVLETAGLSDVKKDVNEEDDFLEETVILRPPGQGS